MNVRDLLDVQAICQAGSFRKAAAMLGITQPTLSARITHLEDQLGASLFERSRGLSRPTALADFIAARAATISTDATLLTRELRRMASGQTGLVRLGLGPAPASALVVPLVAAVRVRRPDISLEIRTGSSSALRAWLLAREVDVVLSAPLEPVHPAVTAEPLLEVENVIVAHPDHPMFTAAPAGIRELFRYPVALPFMEPRYSEFILAQFGVDIERLPGRLICSDFELLARVTADAPHFFTAGPRFVFASAVAAGRLRVLALSVPVTHLVSMHTNSDACALPAVAEVQAVARQACAAFGATTT